MVDFHTHILPGIDDGSQDVDMTKDMLLEEQKQGVGLIAATPHFYAHRMSMEGFLERRTEAMAKTLQICRSLEEDLGRALPEILAGAEVYYFPGVGKAKDVTKLCIGDSRCLLLELPFEQWGKDVLKDVRDLIFRQKLCIILAHIERYIGFQKDRSIWDEIMELPVHAQINAGSFLRKNGILRPDKKKRFCMLFLGEHPGTLLGSDCHNMTDRPPNVEAARKFIAEYFGDKALAYMDEVAEKILTI